MVFQLMGEGENLKQNFNKNKKSGRKDKKSKIKRNSSGRFKRNDKKDQSHGQVTNKYTYF